jgi:hypothetical protein
MGKHAEQQSAARQFYADAPRPKTAREVCEEADEMRAVLIDEWADKLVGGGDVPRVYAQRCAVLVVAELRGREGRSVAGGGRRRGKPAGAVEGVEGDRGEDL